MSNSQNQNTFSSSNSLPTNQTIEEEVLHFLSENRQKIDMVLPSDKYDRESIIQGIGRLVRGLMNRTLLEIAETDGEELLSIIEYLKSKTQYSGDLLSSFETDLKNAVKFSTSALAKSAAVSAALKSDAEWENVLKASHELKSQRAKTTADEEHKNWDHFNRLRCQLGSKVLLGDIIPSGATGSGTTSSLATGVVRSTGVSSLAISTGGGTTGVSSLAISTGGGTSSTLPSTGVSSLAPPLWLSLTVGCGTSTLSSGRAIPSTTVTTVRRTSSPSPAVTFPRPMPMPSITLFPDSVQFSIGFDSNTGAYSFIYLPHHDGGAPGGALGGGPFIGGHGGPRPRLDVSVPRVFGHIDEDDEIGRDHGH